MDSSFAKRTAREALHAFEGGPFDLAILDLRMPEMDGLDLLAEMRARGIHTPTLIITAHGDLPHAVKAIKLGAIDFLRKPLTPDQLRRLVAEVLFRHAKPVVAELSNMFPEGKIDSAHHLLAAKRAINNREFDMAREHLIEALKQNEHMLEVHNLLGVLSEMKSDYKTAGKCYARAMAIDSRYEPAMQNMRRLTDLFTVGSSKEPFNLGE